MNKLWKVVLLAILAIGLTVGVICYVRNSSSDTAKITKIVNNLADAITREKQEKLIVAMSKVKNLTDSLTDPADITLGKYISGKMSSAELTSLLGRFRSLIKVSKGEISDLEIRLLNANQAQLIFTGSVSGQTKSGDYFHEAQEIAAIAVKIDGKWKISALAFRNVLH